MTQNGQSAVELNFKVVTPGSLSGNVFEDSNNDGVRAATDRGIAQVELVAVRRTLGGDDPFSHIDSITVQTNNSGQYFFAELPPGVYDLFEVNEYGQQPNPLAGYQDGFDIVGTINGEIEGQIEANDQLGNIQLASGQAGSNYDFAEFRTGSISGNVHAAIGGDCTDPNVQTEPIAGVSILLVNESEQVVARATTDLNGDYEFRDLLPGNYSVVEQHPNGYFDGTQFAGQLAGETTLAFGDASTPNRIQGIVVESGQEFVDYQFCELKPSEISGVVFQDGEAIETETGGPPSNYRQLVDGIYNPGTDAPIPGSTVQIWRLLDPNDPDGGLVPVTINDLIVSTNTQALQRTVLDPASTPETLTVQTDSFGRYRFEGLPPGNYVIVQQQPTGFVDANDSSGFSSALAINSPDNTSALPAPVRNTIAASQWTDVISGVTVNSGDQVNDNNFGETLFSQSERPDPPDPPEDPNDPEDPRKPNDPPRFNPPTPPISPLAGQPGLASAISLDSQFVYASIIPIEYESEELAYTWHMSLVNGVEGLDDGRVKMFRPSTELNKQFESVGWSEESNSGEFTIRIRGQESKTFQFGPEDGIPVIGDYDGDGDDDLAIFREGYWWIDLNGDGSWDDDDLLARLGTDLDQPVAGDWDGDGKIDIGIYGPKWDGDAEAIEVDPGFPDKANTAYLLSPYANKPVGELVDGHCDMKPGRLAMLRAEVVDHVFGYGEASERAFVGDFNGDGVATIGLHRQGQWRIDSNGDGKIDESDLKFRFGDRNSFPVIGDFNGDGIDEIASYRDGLWNVDINNNYQSDAADMVFKHGNSFEFPIAGDFDGDGTDEFATFERNGLEQDRDIGEKNGLQ